MAVVQYGVIVTELKGKVQGQVFQAGNNSLVLRNKGYRKGVSSAPRLRANLNMTSQTSRWRTLSASDRSAWDAATTNWAYLDKYGNSYFGSGYQMFVAYNSALMSLGLSAVNTPNAPVSNDPVAVTAVSINSGSTFNVTFTHSGSTAQSYQWYASAPVSQGRNGNNLRLRLIKTNTSTPSSPLSLNSEYNAVYVGRSTGAMIKVVLYVRVNAFPYPIKIYEGNTIVA